LLKQQLKQWAESISTAENSVIPYLIEVDVSDIENVEERKYFNNIPTSFVLEKE